MLEEKIKVNKEKNMSELSDWAYERGKKMVKTFCERGDIVNWCGLILYKESPYYKELFQDKFKQQISQQIDRPLNIG